MWKAIVHKQILIFPNLIVHKKTTPKIAGWETPMCSRRLVSIQQIQLLWIGCVTPVSSYKFQCNVGKGETKWISLFMRKNCLQQRAIFQKVLKVVLYKLREKNKMRGLVLGLVVEMWLNISSRISCGGIFARTFKIGSCWIFELSIK